MRILVTNDDGITSVGIKALADAAIRRGHEVLISAPSDQCSANSQHITLTTPLIVHEKPWEGARAFSVKGTPADCVRLGPFLTDERKFDFCLSGINNSENAGPAVYYSGTASAAREAAMAYIPAMAVSIMKGAGERALETLAGTAVRLAERFSGETLPRCTFINLNAPNTDPEAWKGFKVCPLSGAYFKDNYVRRKNPYGTTYYWLDGEEGSAIAMEEPEPGSDYDLLNRGYVTCSFLGPYQDYNADYLEKIRNFRG